MKVGSGRYKLPLQQLLVGDGELRHECLERGSVKWQHEQQQ